jgi:hypothetical protein
MARHVERPEALAAQALTWATGNRRMGMRYLLDAIEMIAADATDRDKIWLAEVFANSADCVYPYDEASVN